jgi:hypothetical protein
MFNGLMLVAEVIDTKPKVQIKSALALAPGQQQGQMQLMEAFPFTDLNEVVSLENGSFITITELADERLRSMYLDGIQKIRSQKAGIVLP